MVNDGVPLVRRMSGGGTVYHDLNNSNVSLLGPRNMFNKITNSNMLLRAIVRRYFLLIGLVLFHVGREHLASMTLPSHLVVIFSSANESSPGLHSN